MAATPPAAVDGQPRSGTGWTPVHLAALLAANVALALGPWLVRLADTGPVAAGFWRLALAFPVLVMLSLREPAAQRRLAGGMVWLVAGAGLAFGLDLASWHVGIVGTKLGNASLFGNAGSVILMAWGLVTARRAPRLLELVAIAAALGGAALLMGGSLEISRSSFIGDLFCLLAGVFYAIYILMLRPARLKLGQFTLLGASMLVSAPVMLAVALLLGETIWPQDWTPLIALAISSQLIGQGFLIYSLRHFPPLVIGLALLTQPAISSTIGWLAFGETLTALDVLGMVLLASALVMARSGDKA
ncbi:DMT family transporter [Novosphingobium aquimarinum]|uniref:DMT family transporter n=1 Tax=Novosphingobium aquimarinum TaxID=2682494 RepID=UPI0012EBBE94|nr:DMT family transporter [Novosphingobium aquimarinum]